MWQEKEKGDKREDRKREAEIILARCVERFHFKIKLVLNLTP